MRKELWITFTINYNCIYILKTITFYCSQKNIKMSFLEEADGISNISQSSNTSLLPSSNVSIEVIGLSSLFQRLLFFLIISLIQNCREILTLMRSIGLFLKRHRQKASRFICLIVASKSKTLLEILNSWKPRYKPPLAVLQRQQFILAFLCLNWVQHEPFHFFIWRNSIWKTDLNNGCFPQITYFCPFLKLIEFLFQDLNKLNTFQFITEGILLTIVSAIGFIGNVMSVIVLIR